MKKCILCLLAFSLLLSLSACKEADEADYASEKELYEEGLFLIETMSEMIQSEEYLKIYSADQNMSSLAESIDTGDYDNPIAIYRIEMPTTEEYFESFSDSGKELWEELSPALQKQVENRITFATIASQINGQKGSTPLAFSSIFIASEKNSDLILEEDTVFLYVFDEGTPISVTFTESGAMQGQFVFVEDIENLSDAKTAFKQYKCSVHRVDID